MLATLGEKELASLHEWRDRTVPRQGKSLSMTVMRSHLALDACDWIERRLDTAERTDALIAELRKARPNRATIRRLWPKRNPPTLAYLVRMQQRLSDVIEAIGATFAAMGPATRIGAIDSLFRLSLLFRHLTPPPSLCGMHR